MANEFLTAAIKPFSICLERLTPAESKQRLSYETKFGSAVKCPSCTLSYTNTDECAQHLLYGCLQINCLDDEDVYRSRLIEWVINYKKSHKLPIWPDSKDVPETYKLSVILQDHYSNPKQARLEVKIPEIPSDLKCPVCCGYFHSSEACVNHLFESCLSVKTGENALLVKQWLSIFSWSINVKVPDSGATLVPEIKKLLICKYCQNEFLDSTYLKEHFKLFHNQQDDLEAVVCVLCNFHALSLKQLVTHVIWKHIKCGCRAKAHKFRTLKEHLRLCIRSCEALCPICKRVKMDSFGSENTFAEHLWTCTAQDKVKLPVDDLYFNCDVCHHTVMKLDADAHLKWHLINRNGSRLRQRRVFISLNAIKDIIPAEVLQKLDKLNLK